MQSMTGYGAATGKVGRGRVTIEVKTFNHRYCEVTLKIPPRFGSLEKNFREVLQPEFERGKVEVFLKEAEPIFGKAALVLNLPLAKQYQQALGKLQKALKIPGKPNPLAWTSLDHFIQAREREGDYTHYQRQIEQVLQKAIAQVQKMRSKEGQFLLRDQKKRLKDFMKCQHHIETINAKDMQKRRSESSLIAINNETPNSHFTKADITEELTRLKSHTRQYAELLGKKEPIGRKLDFLIQEMHREMNTIGAKASNAKVSQYIVESKSLLENLREQVQNIL